MRPTSPRSETPGTVHQPPRMDEQRPPLNSRIISSVRRTLSTAKRRDPVPSSIADRSAFPRFRYDSTAPPTVEQIAMGLHLSRTPHLRSSKDGPVRYPAPPEPTIKAIPPVQPLRSSLKKGHGPASSSSTTDVTSTPPSSERSSASLRARMSRLIPHRGPHPSSTPSSSVSSPRTSTSGKKAVRFSNPVPEDE